MKDYSQYINFLFILAYINKGLNTFEKLKKQFPEQVILSDSLVAMSSADLIIQEKVEPFTYSLTKYGIESLEAAKKALDEI